MENHCVIAVPFENYYVACVCHCDSAANLWILLQSYSTPELAHGLAFSGDFTVTPDGFYSSFYRDFGFLWSQCCPIVLENAETLIQHCHSVQASEVYVYEHGRWQNEWLLKQQESKFFA